MKGLWNFKEGSTFLWPNGQEFFFFTKEVALRVVAEGGAELGQEMPGKRTARKEDKKDDFFVLITSTRIGENILCLENSLVSY